MAGVIAITSPFTPFAQNVDGQNAFCNNANVNINNNDLSGHTFTGGAGQAQTGTGGAGDTLTGGNTIE